MDNYDTQKENSLFGYQSEFISTVYKRNIL